MGVDIGRYIFMAFTITDQHWKVFQLVEQEKRGYRYASELLNISFSSTKRLLRELREMQPDLFPIETEVKNLNQQIPRNQRKKYNTQIVSYEARKNRAENIDDEIKMKF